MPVIHHAMSVIHHRALLPLTPTLFLSFSLSLFLSFSLSLFLSFSLSLPLAPMCSTLAESVRASCAVSLASPLSTSMKRAGFCRHLVSHTTCRILHCTYCYICLVSCLSSIFLFSLGMFLYMHAHSVGALFSTLCAQSVRASMCTCAGLCVSLRVSLCTDIPMNRTECYTSIYVWPFLRVHM